MRPRHEHGFTLIEVMVVVLIVAILAAIALPTMLAARVRSEDRAAHVDLRNALAAAWTWFSDDADYDGFTVDAARALQPSLRWARAGDPADSPAVVIVEASGHELVLVRRSRAGTYFCLADRPGPGFSAGRASAYAAVDSAGECAGGW